MIDFFIAYRPVVDLFLLSVGFAFSQWIVLRAGAFSVANAALTSIGAYTAAILTVDHGVHWSVSLVAATLVGALVGIVLSLPLARLRGVYQAIATLAFVQVVVSLTLYAEGLTHGALGFNGIPKIVDTSGLLIAAAGVTYLMLAIDATRIGRAFEALRQDEAVAASLGVSIAFHQRLAFALSGAIAGLFGGLEAFHSYSLQPESFGFGFMVAALSYVVLGGRRSVLGPIVGAAILVSLPEIARPLAEARMLVYGLILMAVIAFLPRGVVDTALSALRKRRLAGSTDARS